MTSSLVIAPVLARVFDEHEGKKTPRGWLFWCIGCAHYHEVTVEVPNVDGHRWAFDGNVEAPTFSPAIETVYVEDGGRTVDRCFLVVEAGWLVYGPNCTHRYAGNRIPMDVFDPVCPAAEASSPHREMSRA